MQKARVLVLLAAPLVLAACSKDKPPPIPVSFDDVCNAQYAATDDNGLSAQKRVQVEGYLAARTTVAMCGRTCTLELSGQPDGAGKKISAYVNVGTGANTMDKLPDKFGPTDIKVRDKNGGAIPLNAKVRVTGGRGGSGTTCYLDVEALERS